MSQLIHCLDRITKTLNRLLGCEADLYLCCSHLTKTGFVMTWLTLKQQIACQGDIKAFYIWARSYANNKRADQPVHPRSLISAFVVCYLGGIIHVPILAISKVSASVAEQGCLSLTWSQIPINTFSHVVTIFFNLFVLRLNVPVNNFPVMSGRSHHFLGN